MKNFSRKQLKMKPVHSKKLGKSSVRKQKPLIRHPQYIFKIALRFTVKPAEMREKYVTVLDDMIKRVQRIINARKTKTKQRLRAMQVLTELIKTSYSMIRDIEIEELEREIKKLEKETK